MQLLYSAEIWFLDHNYTVFQLITYREVKLQAQGANPAHETVLEQPPHLYCFLFFHFEFCKVIYITLLSLCTDGSNARHCTNLHCTVSYARADGTKPLTLTLKDDPLYLLWHSCHSSL